MERGAGSKDARASRPKRSSKGVKFEGKMNWMRWLFHLEKTPKWQKEIWQKTIPKKEEKESKLNRYSSPHEESKKTVKKVENCPWFRCVVRPFWDEKMVGRITGLCRRGRLGGLGIRPHLGGLTLTPFLFCLLCSWVLLSGDNGKAHLRNKR